MNNLENNPEKSERKVDKKSVNKTILIITLIVIIIGITFLIIYIQKNNKVNTNKIIEPANVNKEAVLEDISEKSINNLVIDLQKKNSLLKKVAERSEEESLLK